MMISALTAYLLTLCVIIFYCALERRPTLNHPPGPRGIPLIGNALAVMGKPFVTYARWQRDHGDIFWVTFGPIRVLVLGTPELIKEAFQHANFNGRPSEWSAILLTDGRNGLLTTEGPIWEEQRRFTVKVLRSFGVGKKTMETSIMAEVEEFIKALSFDCGKSLELKGRFELAVANVLWKIVGGKRFQHDDHEKLELLRNLYKTFGQPTVTAITMLLAPVLLKIAPRVFGLTSTLKVRDDFHSWLEEEINEHLTTLPADGIPRDYIDAYLMEIEKTQSPKSSFYGKAGTKSLVATIAEFFFGATETTTLSMLWMILFISAHEDVQKKLQEEIDRVVPSHAAHVTLFDRPNLPYAEAVVLESFRHAGIVTTGIMHRVVENANFHGYDIPANTWIMPNIHAILHDERFWPNPNKFMPERFLSPEGKVLPRQSNLVSFSLGRRSCLGEPLAKDEIFLFLTNIYRRFDIFFDPSKPKPDMSPKRGFLLCPHDYHVIVTERYLHGQGPTNKSQ